MKQKKMTEYTYGVVSLTTSVLGELELENYLYLRVSKS